MVKIPALLYISISITATKLATDIFELEIDPSAVKLVLERNVISTCADPPLQELKQPLNVCAPSLPDAPVVSS